MKRRAKDLISLAGILLLLFAIGCATSGEGTTRQSGTITRAELDNVSAFRVDEAVQLLRPTWMLRLSGACYEERPLTTQELADLPLTQILEIRYITGAQATTICGLTASAGSNVLHIIRR